MKDVKTETNDTVRTCAAITKKVKKLDHLRDQLKTLSAIEKGLVDDIKGYINDAEVLEGVNGEVLATYKPYTSRRFDAKAFKEQEPALYDKFLATVNSRKFLIK